MRAILQLAQYYGRGPLQTKMIAAHQQLSVKYLEQLMAILKTAGLIRSIRGSKGGYILAKRPDKIKLSACFNALEGPVTTVECVGDASYCEKTAACVTRQLWAEIEDAVTSVLDSKTLQDLVKKAGNSKALIYEI